MADVKGIDISEYQGSVDFVEVKASGIDVVYIKATEGTTYVNPNLKTSWKGAKDAGVDVGFYHFFRAKDEDNAKQQAQYFVNSINGMIYDCRLVLDIETNEGVARPFLSTVAKAFLDEVEALTGLTPAIYTCPSFISENLDSTLAAYLLWIADYSSEAPGSNSIWNSWVGWQHSDSGTVSGVAGHVDLDVFTSDIFATGVIIIAGSTTLFGQLSNSGSTCGPIAAICKAKGIAYAWDAAKQIMCLAGASDANVSASGVQIVAGSQVIAGQLLGGSTWAPVAAVLNALGISYTWNQATRTLTF
jgi:GH25 family lysozyme M1 (1,4-beta-N-acetylmuramidase)